MNEISDVTEWCLRGELKDSSPWIIPIDRPLFSIGRQDNNDLILPSHSVSRRHARIINEGGELQIEDLESKNGVLLNGKKIESKGFLRQGDIIKIGDSEFTLGRTEDFQTKYEEQTLARSSEATRLSFADAFSLSEREKEILFFLIKGHSLKQIGESLFISAGTVKNHVLKIYKKTGCHTRIELSTKFAEYGANR
ncbi:MAG: FHA domain-containing protein [Spirochaetales bacterium]|nr:FHA domain-containing protein [Spirochaetales bacterium]